MTPTGHNHIHGLKNLHAFASSHGNVLLEVQTGRLLHVEERLLDAIEEVAAAGDMQRAELMGLLAGISPVNVPHGAPPEAIPLQSLSLAIAQKCNLGCTYCYAEQGTFGSKPDNMTAEVAKASVDRLIQDTPPGGHITLAFMGGEPLFNRHVLYETAEYAVEKAAYSGHTVGFTITTNATLLRPEDAEFFQKHRFTVTVSVDGTGKTNDALRPYISGKGSFEQVREKLKLLFAVPGRRFQVFARVTVTPKNLDLPQTFTDLLDLGFDSVQFSPMLKSPTGKEQMNGEDFDVMLEQLTACGEMFRRGFMEHRLLPLQNVLSTLKRIHAYERDVYPCGAGGGYMGVSAEGKLYACHRFVNDDDRHMGNVETGVDSEKQSRWLTDRHLDSQSACNTCWARHLCGGSCHHEVINRGRPACDYIRGWLHYCLGLYVDLLKADPQALALLLGNSGRLMDVSENEDGTGLQH